MAPDRPVTSGLLGALSPFHKWDAGASRCRGALSELSKKPGRPKQDENILELKRDLERTEKALKELAIENTLLRGKVNGV